MSEEYKTGKMECLEWFGKWDWKEMKTLYITVYWFGGACTTYRSLDRQLSSAFENFMVIETLITLP